MARRIEATFGEIGANRSRSDDFETIYRSALKRHGYQFTQVIGKGGMSRVDEVRDVSTGELKAIKHLGNKLPAAKVERFRKMLRRESEYSFDHPHVLKGETYFEDNGNIFYVMPRMHHNLEHLIDDEEKYSLAFLLDMSIQIVAGLNYLHQNGIIHRDLKPSNILYNVDGEKIWAVICDFGLSQDKMAKFRTDLSRKLLGGGRRAGTLNYSAPEQLRKQAKYDKRCDIYSLGRVLDELFGKKIKVGKKYINTFQQDRRIDAHSRKVHLYKMNRPFILEGQIREYLPHPLLDLILRCLQKNPKRRPADIVQVFYELTKIQQECHIALRVEVRSKEVLTR